MSALRRIIFSRKGLDSAAGGAASPVVAGRPLSLPIPAGRYPGGRRYGALAGQRAALAAAVSGGRLGPDMLCHLDPDIDAEAMPSRLPGWRGAFGQCGAALGHLRNAGVGAGDLFLFFGRFRPVEQGRSSARDVHAVYGWLQVGDVLAGDALQRGPRWLADHPHVAPGWPANNAIYVASDRLDLPGVGDVPGWGVFDRPYVLSEAPGVLSRWRVPAWLERARMTYHRADRCWPGGGGMMANGQWQEGVAQADAAAAAWAGALIAGHVHLRKAAA